MGFLLSIIALILFVFVYILDEITVLVIDVKNRKWFKITAERKFKKAFKVDVFANNLFPSFWNAALSKGGYQFGRFGETLSSVFGKKRLEKSLSWLGWLVSILIDAIDFTKWNKGGHCIASIMTDEAIESFIVK
ncbi:hypothetical protein [Flavobacterium sp. UMI-01]|uniref:hypothetical protein n=1 Tax=Flavobacterium sp. UMI-01 TaxID=1441053 RepID=UPI001C7CE36C|nr:hypothetical protein [Flavobacterium sp. UMI-01]GIZ09969.1 hypothetical protein FUMI01_26950 [Flavobacterium sp. UMI-01]